MKDSILIQLSGKVSSDTLDHKEDFTVWITPGAAHVNYLNNLPDNC